MFNSGDTNINYGTGKYILETDVASCIAESPMSNTKEERDTEAE